MTSLVSEGTAAPPPNIYSSRCYSRRTLELIGDKWVVLVVRALEGGPQHYGELRRRIQGVTKKMLTQTLRELERNGLVRRRVVDSTNPPMVEYSLSPLGSSLLGPIKLLSDWAMDHLDQVRRAQESYDDRAPGELGT